jgi:excisionase family DNA binding protein
MQENQKAKILIYSVAEALQIMKISRTKLYQEVAAGRLKIHKSGRTTLIKAASLKEWIANLTPVEPGKA